MNDDLLRLLANDDGLRRFRSRVVVDGPSVTFKIIAAVKITLISEVTLIARLRLSLSLDHTDLTAWFRGGFRCSVTADDDSVFLIITLTLWAAVTGRDDSCTPVFYLLFLRDAVNLSCGITLTGFCSKVLRRSIIVVSFPPVSLGGSDAILARFSDPRHLDDGTVR